MNHKTKFESWINSGETEYGTPVVEIEYPTEENEFKLMSIHSYPEQIGILINFGWRKGGVYTHSESIPV